MVFIGWIIVSFQHRVVLRNKIQVRWVLGVRDLFCVMISISGHYAVCFVEHSKSVKQSLQGWSSVVCGHVHVAVVVQVIGEESHLQGNGCDEHVWSSSVRWGGFTKWCRWDPISDRWILALFTSRYLWLFHCEFSWYSTSVKVPVWRYKLSNPGFSLY